MIINPDKYFITSEERKGFAEKMKELILEELRIEGIESDTYDE